MKFDELNIDERILRAIEDMGFEETSPIQTQAIPAVCEGIDVVGQAQTGTGKTAAYTIPMLMKIDPQICYRRLIQMLRNHRQFYSALQESLLYRWLRR